MWLAALVAAAVLAAVALLYFRQHTMIYHPRPYGPEFANSLPPGVVELRYRTIAGAQSAFYLARGAEQPIPARIWMAFPGNGSLALEWLGLIARDPNPANAYLLVDYPGYGRNEGYAAIATNRAVADGALEALEKHFGVGTGELDSRLNIIGHSFGCGAGLDFASRHSANRIVLVAPFTSLREAAAAVVGELLSHLLIENYDNRARLSELAARENPPRIAIFHGTDDDIIPVRMARELAAAHPTMIRFVPLEGGDHLTPLFKNGDQILASMNEERSSDGL
ncbi:MAG TPA: alpha/beta hydrolase [Chthoniobacterales bacterium]